mgnify:CR=1 FL=1
MRRLIASRQPGYELSGEVEADESYFGGRRKGGRGRVAGCKVAVFGFLKRGGKVFTAIIPDARTRTLVAHLVELCGSLELETIAEMIEALRMAHRMSAARAATT